MTRQTFRNAWIGYPAAVLGLAAVSGILKLFGERANPTTVALALILFVLFTAAAWGSGPAVLASLLGVLCFNFFFLPPIGAFTISDPSNWIAFFAFLITAVTAGQMSALLKRRAEEAAAARRQIEQVYRDLQESFEHASQAKALEQSERLKSALLDAVTHDLRTPLTSIKASVTTLLEELNQHPDDRDSAGLDREGRKEMLEIIDEEADRLNRFIEGLMELARIEAGEMQLRRQWGSIEEIVRAALERAAPLTRHHRMEVQLDNELPAVRVDERAVAEVVYTLVDNAAKYSPAETVIRVAASSGSDGEVILRVQDEGPGIPVELRERVFDKFFRAIRDGDLGVGRPSGSGMGLAIARGIVEAHGGHISIDGTEHHGTGVTVRLPTGD